MTKKDYVAISKALLLAQEDLGWRKMKLTYNQMVVISHYLAAYFRTDNMRFDNDKWDKYIFGDKPIK